MTEKELITNLKDLGIMIKRPQLDQLNLYYQMLITYNKQMNLTTITDQKEVYLKHFYDSLTIARDIDLTKETKLCDLGTGAGFPGLVLKIVYPNLEVTLVDSLLKRLHFLEQVIHELQLTNVTLVHARAEDYAREQSEQYDVVTARAVASLPILLEYAMPLLKVGKYFIAMKANASEELSHIDHALKCLDAEIIKIDEFNFPGNTGHRTIIKVKKVKATKDKYPRKYSEIKNKPL